VEAVERQGIEVFGAHYSAFATSLGAKPKHLPELPPQGPDDPTDGPPALPGISFLAIFSELARVGKTNAVRALTQATGGSDHPFLKEHGIENAIQKPSAEVHSQYILSFLQRLDTEGMHVIEVSVPERADLRIRSRRFWRDISYAVPVWLIENPYDRLPLASGVAGAVLAYADVSNVGSGVLFGLAHFAGECFSMRNERGNCAIKILSPPRGFTS